MHSEATLVNRLVGHDVRLAEADSPAAQLLGLVDVAEDLQEEALRCLRDGATEQMPVIAGLHEQVVRRGLGRRAATLPENDRPRLARSVAERLQRDEARLTNAADDAVLVVGELLRGMAASCKETAHAVERGSTPRMPASVLDEARGARPLLASLVLGGMRLADETDPLRRAATCTDVADALVQSIVLASAAGDDERSDWLGKNLGTFLDRGLTPQLARVPADLSEEQQADYGRVQQRVSAATAALERNLEKAPAPARAGLQRAMEASRHGRERAAEASKGKARGRGNRPDHAGPPKDRGPRGKPDVPPGLKKKNMPND